MWDKFKPSLFLILEWCSYPSLNPIDRTHNEHPLTLMTFNKTIEKFFWKVSLRLRLIAIVLIQLKISFIVGSTQYSGEGHCMFLEHQWTLRASKVSLILVSVRGNLWSVVYWVSLNAYLGSWRVISEHVDDRSVGMLWDKCGLTKLINSLTPKIWCSWYTFPCKLVTRMWC